MQSSLLKAIRAVDLVDSQKDRQDFFDYYVNKYQAAKLLIKFHSFFKGTKFSALMYYVFAARYLIKNSYTESNKYKLLATVDYINEERAIVDFLALVNDNLKQVNKIDNINLVFPILLKLITNPKDFFRVLDYLVRFEKKGTFLTCCRVAELFFLYNIAKIKVKKLKPKAVIAASNYTPCSCALFAAAENFKIPKIYTFHAVVTSVLKLPPLRADLACLYGERAIDAFKFHGNIECKEVVFSGLSGESKKMKIRDSFQEVQTVGIFLTAYIEDPTFKQLLTEISALSNVKEIIVRAHPLKEANPDLEILSAFPKVKLDQEKRAIQAAAKCDLVIAGSSAVHVEVLKSGVPTLYWDDFDTVGPDYYSFIKYGVVCEVKTINNIDWNAVKNFYNSEWEARFKKLDYSYFMEKEQIRKNVELAFVKILNNE